MRNLLQSLALSRFEIPIDSRITKWLNTFGFPVTLSSMVLADRDYYLFVSDGIQRLCEASGVMPTYSTRRSFLVLKGMSGPKIT